MCAAGTPRPGHTPITESHTKWLNEALTAGPDALAASQKMHLLNDSSALSRLHFEVWTSARAHIDWQMASAQTKH